MLLKYVFKERPYLPRYTATYDLKIVFDYIKTYNISIETPLVKLMFLKVSEYP